MPFIKLKIGKTRTNVIFISVSKHLVISNKKTNYFFASLKIFQNRLILPRHCRILKSQAMEEVSFSDKGQADHAFLTLEF